MTKTKKYVFHITTSVVVFADTEEEARDQAYNEMDMVIKPWEFELATIDDKSIKL